MAIYYNGNKRLNLERMPVDVDVRHISMGMLTSKSGSEQSGRTTTASMILLLPLACAWQIGTRAKKNSGVPFAQGHLRIHRNQILCLMEDT